MSQVIVQKNIMLWLLQQHIGSIGAVSIQSTNKCLQRKPGDSTACLMNDFQNGASSIKLDYQSEKDFFDKVCCTYLLRVDLENLPIVP